MAEMDTDDKIGNRLYMYLLGQQLLPRIIERNNKLKLPLVRLLASPRHASENSKIPHG